MASKLKPVDYSGYTEGELTSIYRAYAQVLHILISKDDKSLLPRVIERMSAVNKAKQNVAATVQDYFHNLSYMELAEPNFELYRGFYDKFVQDWDSDRCDQYFKTMDMFQGNCTNSVRARKKMLDLLGL
ncbi:hypothetical protein VPMG_00029 [Vibrio phage VBP32]|uniref:Uncharacterized protein n=2 Tax=Stoningtonvirus VBP47 TaxID=2846606 RepID=M4SM86_9CAUD|nr:hypothetical protein VPNG_00099 [Vibrio phage VBP47]YP_007676519.1 hypothetical protein VPMG_00029 [Vibrio phage VBP32]AGH57123.1 hypothetical protein VPNG_00099 [Vibrio phage VBP47]AGH57168.1 hypothetical protein VPMG_00029 [Vibrio phage VBP32]